jgi:hypothetical protein
MKMEGACFSEMLQSTYKSTWRHNTEEQHRQEEGFVFMAWHLHTQAAVPLC